MAFPTGYTKYQEVVIQSAKVDADLTDYPIYIDLSDLDKATDIFDTCRADGGDIRVTKSDGTTQLPREVVAIDTGAKTGELHIKYTGTLSSSSNTTIRIWYNGTDTEPAIDSTYGAENVWNSNYRVVYHMSDASTPILDSTANDNDGAEVDNPTYQQTGQIGKAIDFDGSDYFNIGKPTTNPRIDTISFWLKTSQATEFAVFGSYDGAGLDLHSFLINQGGTANKLRFQGRGHEGDYYRVEATLTDATDGSWHYIQVARDVDDAGSKKVFLDGASKATSGDVGPPLAYSIVQDFFFGADSSVGTPARWLTGSLDEFRWSSVVLSDGWLTTEYNNQKTPSTFYSVGGEIVLAVTFTSKVMIY